ncbi:MAG: hypothetical protein IKF17_01720 [Clostridia bacterium]|nr:hypothetical protein [Clostridia bacterium]
MINNAKDKGITLVSLVITIVILLILSTITYQAGKGTIQNARLTSYTTEMSALQQEVNKLEQQYRSGDTSVLNMGQETDGVEGAQEAFTNAGVSDTTGYRYFTQATLQELGLDSVEHEFLVNVQKRDIISLDGIKYNGQTYYKLADLPNGLYNVEHEETASGIRFSVNSDMQGDKMRINIYDIVYEGNVKKGTIYYGIVKDGQVEWKKATNETTDTTHTIEVLQEGTYKVKIVDTAGNESAEQTISVNVANYEIAETGKKFVTLADAIDGADSNQTIKQIRSYTDASEATVDGKTIKFDNNGKVLTKTEKSIRINDNASLEITGNGTITTNQALEGGSNYSLISNYGTLNITHTGTISNTYTGTAHCIFSGNTLNITGKGTITSATSWVTICVTGEDSNATISAGTISNTASNGALHIHTNATATIENNAHLTSNIGNTVQVGHANNSSLGHLTITGGTIEYTGTSNRAIACNYSSTIDISGGTITSNSRAIQADNSGTVTINISGGNITTQNNIAIYKNCAGDLTITGGTINAGSNAIALRGTGNTTITGGKITGGIANESTPTIYNKTDNASLVVSGTAEITNNHVSVIYNDTDTGTINVLGGKIITPGSYAIRNSANGTVIIGDNTKEVVNNDPIIQGGAYGINELGTWKFYNGILKGKTAAYGTEPTEWRNEYDITTGGEIINNIEYKIAYLGVGDRPQITLKETDENGALYSSGTWTNKDINHEIEIDTEKTVEKYQYSIDDGTTWEDINNEATGITITDYLKTDNNITYKISGNTNNSFKIKAIYTDSTESKISAGYTLKICKTAPTITATTYLPSRTVAEIKVNVTLGGGENGPQVSGYYISQDSTAPTNSSEWTETNNTEIIIANLTTGATYYIWVKDEAGNIASLEKIAASPNYVVDEAKYANDFETAMSYSNNGSTIRLLNDYSDTSSGIVNKNITFDISTFNLTRNSQITVNQENTLIINGDEGNSINTTIYNNGTLTIPTGEIINSNENTILIYNNGTFQLSGNTNTSTSNVGIMNYGDMYVTGGRINHTNASSPTIMNYGSLDVSGGTIYSTGSSSTYAIMNFNATEILNIKNATIDVESTNSNAIGIFYNGTFAPISIENTSIDVKGTGTNATYGVFRSVSGSTTSQTTLTNVDITVESDNGTVYGLLSLGYENVTKAGGDITAISTNNSAYGIYLPGHSTLVAENGTITAKGTTNLSYSSNGILIFGNSTDNTIIRNTDIIVEGKTGMGIYNTYSPKLIIESSDIKVNSENTAYGINCIPNSGSYPTELIKTGGSIEVTSTTSSAYGIYINSSSLLTIEDEVINVTGVGSSQGIYASCNSFTDVSMKRIKVNVEASSPWGIYIISAKTLNINIGTVTVKGSDASYGIYFTRGTESGETLLNNVAIDVESTNNYAYGIEDANKCTSFRYETGTVKVKSKTATTRGIRFNLNDAYSESTIDNVNVSVESESGTVYGINDTRIWIA